MLYFHAICAQCQDHLHVSSTCPALWLLTRLSGQELTSWEWKVLAATKQRPLEQLPRWQPEQAINDTRQKLQVRSALW